jgi:small subunit ribosomal protein S4
MARYTGPKTKKARALGEAIFGYDKSYEKRKFSPGQHGPTKRRKQMSDYALQLLEKQKAKYTYGLLERQFRNLFEKARSKSGVTGELLLQLLESRLDNIVFRMGLGANRSQARQLVSHKHVLVNGILSNIPSMLLRPGDVISVRGKSQGLDIVKNNIARKSDTKFSWVEFNPERMEGVFIDYPERERIPEKINEQLIVELYSK